MQEAAIVFHQVAVMFLLIGLGWILSRKRFIGDKAISTLNSLVIYIAGPSIMIRSFDIPFFPEKLLEMGVAAVLSIAVLALAAAVACLLFLPHEGMARYAVVFNNCGFFGIPLVESVLKEGAVFYLTIFMALWNLLCWTWGIRLLSGSSRPVNWKQTISNPACLAVFAGSLLFLSGSENIEICLNFHTFTF